ncbi:MAG: PAS domain S-box protein [Pseudomonadota bacterium]
MTLRHGSGNGGLATGFLVVIGLLLALSGVGLFYLQSMDRTIDHIVDKDIEQTRLATEMYIAARERALQLHAILQEPDPFERDALVPRFHELAAIFRNARAKLLQQPLSAEERRLLERQAAFTAEGSQAQDEVLDLALADHTAEAERHLFKVALPAQNRVTRELRRLLDLQIRNGREAAAQAHEQYFLARRLTIVVAISAVLLAGLIATVVVRRQTSLLARLRESEDEARTMLANIPMPIWFKNTESRIAWCNPGFEKMAGQPLARLIGAGEGALWERGDEGDEEDRKAQQAGQTTSQDRHITTAGGLKAHYIIARTPIRGSDGDWKGVLCVAQDLTTLERMYDLLEQANQELQAQKTALDEHAIVSIADIGGFITYANDKFCEISGYARAEVIGRNHNLLNSGTHPRAFFADMWQTISGGRVWHGEICNRTKDGGLYWVDSSIVPFLDAAGKPYQYISIHTDITARKALEQSLQDINAELQKRVEERTAALSQAMRQLEADIAERARSQALLQQQYQELERLHRELQDAQTQLLQSEKLASIGQLAAGVAHEINNPIGFVQSNLGTLENYLRDLLGLIERFEAAEADLPAGTPARAELEALRHRIDLPFLREDIPSLLHESRDGIGRVRKIVQDLRDFARLDSSPDWQHADLHRGLDSTLNIAQNEIKYRADVVKEYGEIPEVECLPSQLNQVFMNLLVNAAQAMDGPRGTITLRTGTAASGAEVWVEVADTGKGIPEEILGRIFDPFFTTKPVGQGTGLGLSLAYSIVQKHNGRLEVQSTVGRGTSFRITLPIHHVARGASPISGEAHVH